MINNHSLRENVQTVLNKERKEEDQQPLQGKRGFS